MAPEPQQPQPPKAGQVSRVFEQPPDAISFYSDQGLVFATPNEVTVQFYETVPGPPSGPGGQMQMVRSRLRATVVLSRAHALSIGQILIQKIEGAVPQPASQQQPGPITGEEKS